MRNFILIVATRTAILTLKCRMVLGSQVLLSLDGPKLRKTEFLAVGEAYVAIL